jgi:hypothetical protein
MTGPEDRLPGDPDRLPLPRKSEEPEPAPVVGAPDQAAAYAAVHRTDAEKAIWLTLQLRNRLAHTYGIDLSVAQLLRAMQATGTILSDDPTHRAARALEVIANTALGPR